jgi:hypothetical protein
MPGTPASWICVPAGNGVHWPAVAGSAQLSQAPLHARLQHTPLEHTVPIVHWLSLVQGAPRLPRGTQRPIWHWKPSMQSDAVVHDERHWVPSQV